MNPEQLDIYPDLETADLETDALYPDLETDALETDDLYPDLETEAPEEAYLPGRRFQVRDEDDTSHRCCGRPSAPRSMVEEVHDLSRGFILT